MSFESYHQSTINISLDPRYWKAECVTCDWEAVLSSWQYAIDIAKSHWRDGQSG